MRDDFGVGKKFRCQLPCCPAIEAFRDRVLGGQRWCRSVLFINIESNRRFHVIGEKSPGEFGQLDKATDRRFATWGDSSWNSRCEACNPRGFALLFASAGLRVRPERPSAFRH
jgi:hypothetical protein